MERAKAERVGGRRKWVIVGIAVLLTVAFVLISVFALIPYAFGSNFVSFSFRPYYYLGEARQNIEIVDFNGSIIGIGEMGLMVNLTNSYFRPVQVRYNGFDFVMLIYNHTVNDPADIAVNKNFLVWGVYYGFYLSPENAVLNGSYFDYYASGRGLSSYVETISPGRWTYYVFAHPGVQPYWFGQDLNGYPVQPGNYYVYCIAYGKTSEPYNLTVTSVLWSR